MGDEERASQIRSLLWQHAHPTLRNMDRQQIATLADEILRIATDRGLWTKWGRDREELAERAWHLISARRNLYCRTFCGEKGLLNAA